MKNFLLLDFCVEEDDTESLVVNGKVTTQKVTLIYTPLEIGTFTPLSQQKKKATCIDRGSGKWYVISQDNKRKLITEVKGAFCVYAIRRETDKTLAHIIKEAKEEKSLDDIFKE